MTSRNWKTFLKLLFLLWNFNSINCRLPIISTEEFLKCSELPKSDKSKILRQTDIIQTNNGKIQGTVHRICNREEELFYGIPYAEPPIGNLRFKKPEPVKNWTYIYNATEKPNSCYQAPDTYFNCHRGVAMWNANTNLSEDCLYLNIWTPTRQRRISVLFWIYGGSFSTGTATLDVYDGIVLAGLFDMVVVTVNYRLGTLGFSYLGNEDIPGNMGLLDQQMALRWVYDNIKYFGGGENLITLWGESAGAACVAFHLINQESQKMFQYAILQSASATAEWAFKTPDIMLNRTKKVAECAGCKNTDLLQLAKCLRSTSPDLLTNCQYIDVGNILFMNITFTPTLDYYQFLSKPPSNLFAEKEFKKSKILAGVTKNEGNYFILYEIDPGLHENGQNLENATISEKVFSSYLSQVLYPHSKDRCVIDSLTQSFYLQYLYNPNRKELNINRGIQYMQVLDVVTGDFQFKCPIQNLANMYSNEGLSVYIYSFEQRTKNNPWPKWMGILHGYEIEFNFGYPLLSEDYTTEEKLLSHKMMTAWTNFANTGYEHCTF